VYQISRHSFLESSGPDNIKLGKDTGAFMVLYKFVLDFRQIAATRNGDNTKATEHDNCIKIVHFLTRNKMSA